MANPAIGLEAIFDLGQFSKNMAQYTKLLGIGEKTTQKTASGMGAVLAGVGKAVGIGAAAGAAALVGAGAALAGFVASSIPAASDLSETVSKVGVVFGDSAQQVLDFGKSAANSLGMSQNTALAAAGVFGNLFRSMGMAEATSADMSTSLVALAGDLASFNNMDPAEVLEKLRAGLTGETEPLKSLGVNLNAAAIQAKALEMGLAETNVDMVKVESATIKLSKAQAEASKAVKWYGEDSLKAREALNKVAKAEQDLEEAMAGSNVELTAEAKAQASYALIMEQTALAQGDFARTSDGLANQQRIMAANWEDLKAKIGTAVLPAVNTLMKAFTEMFKDPRMQKFIEQFASGLSELATKVIPPLAEWLSENLPAAIEWLATTWSEVLWPAMQEIWAWMQTNLFPILTQLWTWLATNIPIAIQTVSDYWNNVLYPALQTVWAWIQTNLIPILSEIWTWLATNIPIAIQTVSDFWTNVLLPAITAVWSWLQSNLFPVLAQLWNWLATNIPAAIQTVVGFWNDTFLPALQAVWGWINENLVPLFNELIGLVGDLLLFAFESVSTFLTTVFTPAIDAGSKIWKNNLLPAIKDVWSWFSTKILPILRDVADFFNNVFNAAIENATRILNEKFGAAIAWVTEQLERLTNWIAELRSMLDNLRGDAGGGGGDGGGGDGGGGGGGGCFVAGTPVSTATGYRPIDEIDIQDEVVVVTERGAVLAPVIGLKRVRRRGLVQVTLSTGRVIVCSDNHRFLMAGGGWSWAGYLQPRTLLVSESGDPIWVESVFPFSGFHTVYDLTVDHADHTFVVAGVVVHNVDQKATGGPVKKGTPYIVGEAGAELFVPGVNGAIIPNNRLSDILDSILAPAMTTASGPTPSGAVTNISNTWNLGGQTINSPMDVAQLQNLIRQTIRAELRGA
jgi:hypothetical protein